MRYIPEDEKELLAISDGKFYTENDLVKVGCHDCSGCSDCCRGMGDTILLDPYDCYRLSARLGLDFAGLLEKYVEFHVEEGLILPNLSMEKTESRCNFLDESGRCSIHDSRPGICRLFPLGRNYTENAIEYFLLTDECQAKNRTKMKVSKWLDAENIKEYEKYLIAWHKLTKEIRAQVAASDDEMKEKISRGFLLKFYFEPYEEGFFGDFYMRLTEIMG